jgi:hypothetical protein
MDIEEGDRVRIDIPDESDPDHYLHGKHGTVQNIIQDDAPRLTGRPEDAQLLTIKLENGEQVDVRNHDIRPPIE